MKVVGYLRVSTDGQEASGLGLADQESKIKGYCELYNLELIGIEKDAASGKNMERPGLQKALAMLKKGQVDGLIVAKLDRLTRSVKDMGFLLEKYFQDKCDLFVVAEQIDTRTAAGRLLLNLLTSVAQWERETIGERTKAALKQKRARGEKTGGNIPYGYQLEDGKLIPEPQEQAIISKMKRWREKGATFQAIADRLNDKGVATKLGRAWDRSKIFQILGKVA